MKKITLYSIIVFSILTVVIAGCQKKETSGISESTANPIDVEVVENEVQDEILFEGESVYGNFFVDGPIIGYSSQKENALADEELSTVVTESEGDNLKSASLGFSVTVNGIDLTQKNNQLKSGNISGNDDAFDSWFGKDVTFLIKKPSMLKSGEIVESHDTVEMYMPELVNIVSPQIATEEELYPYCYFDNFELQWTADELNQNGVVVIVEWLGTVIGQDDSEQYIRNLDVLTEDDGVEVLNNQLFDGIPDKAIAYLTILRGNIAVEDIDGVMHRVAGETHEVLPMILIRNIE